ncbi:killer cell lectin-like receptor subfamily B member 1B allele C [Anomaloglossus baeobatrachus]|uniref:killer cell lectin-like receptor subfamily B member 1B allele C n=1 Tax=Anomaloglossus baeobatrachus TaxID=238106 RepID=UPI003F507483
MKDLTHKPLVIIIIIIVAAVCLLVGGLIGSFIFPSASCDPVPPSCPNKWLRADEKCYFVAQETNMWNSSLHFCKTHGGTLLTPGDETQEVRSFYNLGRDDYWIGLRKDTDSGKWRQLDNSEWTSPVEHDNSKVNCCCINLGKNLALDCSTERRWICVKPL